MWPCLSSLLLLALCGCAYQDSHVAETARHSLIGMSVGDLDMCAGLPTKSEQINPATELPATSATRVPTAASMSPSR